MKVLITGGCGFLGSNIAAYFLKEEARVTLIDALFRPGGERNLAWLQSNVKGGSLDFFPFDLADEGDVISVFSKKGPFDYICHLGGQVAMTTSLADPRRDLLTNVVGTFNMLEATRRYSPEAFFAYSSTNKVYGDLRDVEYKETLTRYEAIGYPEGFNESLSLDFASPYGCSKGAADQYVRDWHRNFGLKTVVFRHSSIYGGRQFSTFDQGWVGWFCQKALEQCRARNAKIPYEPFTIQGSGKQVRDVLHADDLIRLYANAFTLREKLGGEIFNIGGGVINSLSLLELFKLLEKLVDLRVPLVYKNLIRRQSDQDYFVADIRKAERLIGWTPQTTCEKGISQMLEWCSSQGGYKDFGF